MSDAEPPHRRRPRYAGTHPRRFQEKYKELAPERHPDVVAKVRASGKTPAGSHVPVMVREVVEALALHPGASVVDCTVGYGGHAAAMLPAIVPGGRLLALDVDPIELPRTEARLRARGFGPEVLVLRRSNFGGLPRAMADAGMDRAQAIMADLGVSSMQLDAPDRGFTMKAAGPLDMRMNPEHGASAAEWLARAGTERLARVLRDHADEPHAERLAHAVAGRRFPLTTDLAAAIRDALADVADEQRELSVRRVFQALRIVVNDEFAALDTLLRVLPGCLAPGGRVAVLTFHSGEDRRVKQAFRAGLHDGIYDAVADEVGRATPEECRDNPRARPAKLRWAVRSARPAAGRQAG